MNTRTRASLFVGSSIALALALALAVWSPARAQPDDPADGVNMTEAQMTAHCSEMKAAKQKMKDDGKVQDDQLNARLTRMNGAARDAKMDEMSAVINLLVEQRISMDARKAKMEEGMMKHMMQHMRMGKDAAPQCPMMKGMDGKPADAPK